MPWNLQTAWFPVVTVSSREAAVLIGKPIDPLHQMVRVAKACGIRIAASDCGGGGNRFWRDLFALMWAVASFCVVVEWLVLIAPKTEVDAAPTSLNSRRILLFRILAAFGIAGLPVFCLLAALAPLWSACSLH